MPTYEYECSKGHRFEAEQSINDPALKRCRVCRSKVQRLISASAFILKGGGWYSDGYGSAKPGSSSETKAESTPAPKSETKPETKSEPKTKTPAKPSGGSAASSGS